MRGWTQWVFNQHVTRMIGVYTLRSLVTAGGNITTMGLQLSCQFLIKYYYWRNCYLTLDWLFYYAMLKKGNGNYYFSETVVSISYNQLPGGQDSLDLTETWSLKIGFVTSFSWSCFSVADRSASSRNCWCWALSRASSRVRNTFRSSWCLSSC